MASNVETGLQLFSRLNSNNFYLSDLLPDLFSPGNPRANETIEVVGDASVDLLLNFLVKAVLVKNQNNESKCGVILINTDHTLGIVKIAQTIDSHLKKQNIENRKSIVEKALRNLTILNCFGSEQTEITLRGLGNLIQENETVNLVIIDNMTSHFWISRQLNPRLSYNEFCKRNLQLIKSVTKNLNILLLFSHQQFGDLKKSVDLTVDYKIIAERNTTTIIDNVNKSTKLLNH